MYYLKGKDPTTRIWEDIAKSKSKEPLFSVMAGEGDDYWHGQIIFTLPNENDSVREVFLGDIK